MSEWFLPIGVTVAALSLTYFFCLRPRWRGRAGSDAKGGGAGCHATQDAGRSREIETELARARTELAELKAARVNFVPAGASPTESGDTSGMSTR